MVSGSVRTAYAAADSTAPSVQLNVRVAVAGQAATLPEVSYLGAAGSDQVQVTPTGALSVQRGERVVRLQVSQCDPDGVAAIYERGLTTLFVPNGNAAAAPGIGRERP